MDWVVINFRSDDALIQPKLGLKRAFKLHAARNGRVDRDANKAQTICASDEAMRLDAWDAEAPGDIPLCHARTVIEPRRASTKVIIWVARRRRYDITHVRLPVIFFLACYFFHAPNRSVKWARARRRGFAGQFAREAPKAPGGMPTARAHEPKDTRRNN